jgi:ATP-dependent DNA helicase DinG
VTDAVVDDALRRVTGTLAGAEDRPAQRQMATAVARAIRGRRHLVVQAGTGTGKSLGYLVPALVLGTRAVVATATKALQDQLATRDLPVLAEQLGLPLTFAVLKGRSNYFCRQRAAELSGAGDQLSIDAAAADTPGGRELGVFGREIRRLIDWGETAGSGDRAELSWEPSANAWAQVSVGPRDCPGASKCPSGDRCFAEAARASAAKADVVVVNTHLYATHLAAGGGILPDHDLVVFDEAHELEDIASASLGFELTGGRLAALARLVRPLVVAASVADAVDEAAVLLGDALAPHRGTRLTLPLDPLVAERLALTRDRLSRLNAELRVRRTLRWRTFRWRTFRWRTFRWRTVRWRIVRWRIVRWRGRRYGGHGPAGPGPAGPRTPDGRHRRCGLHGRRPGGLGGGTGSRRRAQGGAGRRGSQPGPSAVGAGGRPDRSADQCDAATGHGRAAGDAGRVVR